MKKLILALALIGSASSFGFGFGGNAVSIELDHNWASYSYNSSKGAYEYKPVYGARIQLDWDFRNVYAAIKGTYQPIPGRDPIYGGFVAYGVAPWRKHVFLGVIAGTDYGPDKMIAPFVGIELNIRVYIQKRGKRGFFFSINNQLTSARVSHTLGIGVDLEF